VNVGDQFSARELAYTAEIAAVERLGRWDRLLASR